MNNLSDFFDSHDDSNKDSQRNLEDNSKNQSKASSAFPEGFSVKKTCTECPWLKSAKSGKFPPRKYKKLEKTCQQGLKNKIFACHKTPEGKEKMCAGFFLTEGRNNILVRLGMARGWFDPSEISTTGELHESFADVARTNGYDIETREMDRTAYREYHGLNSVRSIVFHFAEKIHEAVKRNHADNQDELFDGKYFRSSSGIGENTISHLALIVLARCRLIAQDHRENEEGKMTNPAMRLLLKPIGECPQIGKESGVFKKDGISHFITPASPLGSSHRFVFSVNGEIVSALQIMSADGITGKVANIYTEKRFRRNGTATALFRAVQEIFSHVEFGKDFSEDGAAWRDSVD